MKAANLLTQYANVFSKLENRKLCDIDGCFNGEVTLTDDLLKQLSALHSAELVEEILDLVVDDVVKANIAIGDIQTNNIGQKFKIELVATHINKNQMICRNWDALLKYPEYINKPVMAVYFTDTNEMLDSSSGDSKFNNYQNITNICSLIDKVALKNTTDSYSKIVVYDRDVSIKFSLTENDLNFKIETNLLDDFLQKDAHWDVKIALVKQSLVKLLKHKSTNNRLGYLIRHFNGFASDLLVSYHSYVEKYSFDKVRKEYEEKFTLYVEKVNDVFDRASVKLLSIPAGVWFANSQIQTSTLNDLAYMKNISVLASVSVLAMILILNLLGQFSILNTIRSEYKNLFVRLKEDYTKEEENITKVLDKLEDQAIWVYVKLVFSLFSILILLVFPFLLMYKT